MKTQACQKKSASRIQLHHWVFAKSYMPLYDVCISVLCKDMHRLRCQSHKKPSLLRDRLEFMSYKQFQEAEIISLAIANYLGGIY